MHLLFDLDGTLTDSREGIVRCYQHALGELGFAVPPAAELTRYVGPPLARCFAALLETNDAGMIERAVASYRTRFERRGIFENALYPGIAEALEALSAHHTLYIVTAKPTAYAERIVEHFAIARWFRTVYGPELADRQFSKGSLVHAALKDNGVAHGSALVVGDRADDVAAARENEVRSIGVTWGYGSRDELEEAGADSLIDSPTELVDSINRAIGRDVTPVSRPE